MVLAVNPVRDFHLDVPMVFGMISENTRMSIVVTALTSPNQWDPNTIVACLPTPAAPMVLAIVFSERIAARGRDESILYCLNFVAA